MSRKRPLPLCLKQLYSQYRKTGDSPNVTHLNTLWCDHAVGYYSIAKKDPRKPCMKEVQILALLDLDWRITMNNMSKILED